VRLQGLSLFLSFTFSPFVSFFLSLSLSRARALARAQTTGSLRAAAPDEGEGWLRAILAREVVAWSE